MHLTCLDRPFVFVISASLVAFGANPVGRVISSSPVEVDGITAPARNFVPVSIGDIVTTKGGSAVVQFPDGSARLTLQPNSSLKIEGASSNVSVRVVSGSAVYDLGRTSTIHVINTKGEPVSKGAGHSFAAPIATQSVSIRIQCRCGLSAVSAAASPERWCQTPPFWWATSWSSALAAAGGTGGPAVLLPNGLTINLAATTNPTTGAVTYTVVSVTTTVTLPSGLTTSLVITSGGLIGDTITPQQSTQTGTSSSAITITTPTGTPVSNPNTVLQNTVSTGVTTAITNNTLPSGTTAPTPSPVSTGQFSPSGS